VRDKLDNNSGGAPVELDEYLELAGVEVVPVTPAQARIARRAHQRFAKGRHPAALNFGDCFAYALALETAEPLLFKGDDFAQMDLPRVET
jgi:ribonuclease VapC